MKTIRTLLIGLAVLLTVSASAFAQRVIDSTTLSADLSATNTTVSVASVSAASVGEFVFADREIMVITAVGTTTVTVQRGQGGTAAAAHDNAERVFISPGGDFRMIDPDYGQDCTRGVGQAAISPWINVRTGNIWNCRVQSSTWNGTNTMALTFNSIQTGLP